VISCVRVLIGNNNFSRGGNPRMEEKSLAGGTRSTSGKRVMRELTYSRNRVLRREGKPQCERKKGDESVPGGSGRAWLDRFLQKQDTGQKCE